MTNDDGPSSTQRIEAIQHILATVFAAQNALRALAPEFRWTGMGNLLGDFGECLAIDHYGLAKEPAGSASHDALTQDGRTVQIKTNFSSTTIGFRGHADLLLVLRVHTDGHWEQLYFGDYATVKEVASYSKRDNKFTLTVTKLKTLALSVDATVPLIVPPPSLLPSDAVVVDGNEQ